MSSEALRCACAAYALARKDVVKAGYSSDIEWQRTRDFAGVDSKEFLQQLAWVVLCSGMRVSVVAEKFSAIEDAFCDFEDYRMIAENREAIVRRACMIFNNKPKMDAIADAASHLSREGWARVKNEIEANPLERLRQFKYIGPVLVYHLAKNLGLKVAKPDRHLVRIAALYGYYDVQQFCADVSEVVGDPVPVVDIVWWRFAVINSGKWPGYETLLQSQMAPGASS